jgi:hypothetical protein
MNTWCTVAPRGTLLFTDVKDTAVSGFFVSPACHIYTVRKAVWKIFEPRNFPSQHRDNAYSLLENFYSATSKE